MSKQSLTISVALLAALSISVVGCTQNPGSTPSNSPTATPTPTPEYEIAPLTGVSYLKGTNLGLFGPVVMGKIDNAEAARPQNALNRADVVFEEMVEGGMTRFLAVWHSSLPDKFGPVRSVRPMDPDLASPFGGIICISGGQKAFVTAMSKTNVFLADETNQQGKHTFKRVTDRQAPHNVMVNAQKLVSEHATIAPPTSQFAFAVEPSLPTAETLGLDTTSFTVSYPSGKPMWTWNAESGFWMRSQYGTKETDAADKAQLQAKNVVVLKTKIDRSYRDRKYGYIPRTVVVGGGTGVIFSSGKALAITFKKASQTDPITFFTQTGDPVELSPGNTWIELMPSDQGSLKINDKKVAPSSTPTQ